MSQSKSQPLDSGDELPKGLDESLIAIQNALRGLQYGSVTISVQDSTIVQIERIERHRLRLPKGRPRMT
jgi:hypothetical protein